MKLTMLGTGDALVTECYNTCFVIEDEGRYFMVDGGGGNTVLHQLKEAGLDWRDMRDIFVTHRHLDHIMGIIWMVRMICQDMRGGSYDGEARIYGHDEVITLLREITCKLLQPKDTCFIGDRLHLVTVEDGEEREIIGHRVTFFDVGSTKAKQFGFSMQLSGQQKLICCGDEPLNVRNEGHAQGAEWLLHESFCLYSEREICRPYEKHHSTVKDACETAERLGVKNLLLYHTEENELEARKQRYSAEGRIYYHGNLYIPDDLETIEL